MAKDMKRLASRRWNASRSWLWFIVPLVLLGTISRTTSPSFTGLRCRQRSTLDTLQFSGLRPLVSTGSLFQQGYPSRRHLPAGFVGAGRRSGDLRLHPTALRVKVDGPYGVLPESPAPIVEFSEDADPLWERLAMVVQTADRKRGADITAFWINNGFEMVVIITALSRPQLQAIGLEIEYNMRKKLRIKRHRPIGMSGIGGSSAKSDIREEASAGWIHLKYARLSIHIMTPVQRAYYDIEGGFRDEARDYEEINLEPIMREDGFGTMRLRGGLPAGEASDGEDDTSSPPESKINDDYDADEDDPFWS